MKDINDRNHPDVLDKAAAALDAAASAGPPPELTAATLAAIENRLADISPSEPSYQIQRRQKIMRYIRYGILATAAAVLVGVGLLFSFPNAAVAFDKVRDNLKKVEAVSYTDTQVSPDGFSSRVNYFCRGQQTRMELGLPKKNPQDLNDVANNVYVFDYAKRKALSYAPSLSAYELYDVPVEDSDAQAMQFVKEVKRLLDGTAVEVGTEKIDGVKTVLFKIDGGTMYDITADYKVWIDPRTELPVRIAYERKQTDPNDATPVKRTFDRFDWNPKMADKLFSLEPPKGYTVGIEGFIKPKIPAPKK